jgi:hypothetical protein
MVKPKTGRLNYYKQLLKDYHTEGLYQSYLGVEYLNTRQIDEYLNKQKPKPPKPEKEFEIVCQKITKTYPRIIYIKRLVKLIRLIIKKLVSEVITLE